MRNTGSFVGSRQWGSNCGVCMEIMNSAVPPDRVWTAGLRSAYVYDVVPLAAETFKTPHPSQQ